MDKSVKYTYSVLTSSSSNRVHSVHFRGIFQTTAHCNGRTFEFGPAKATTLIMKKILVTGGNKGIGLGIVKKLLRDFSDTYVLLGSRDVGRGEAAIKEILMEMGRIFRVSNFDDQSSL